MKKISSDDIRRAFKGVNLERIDNSMLSKCTSLVNSLNIKPSVMAECWEAFSINKNINVLSDHSWQSFSAELRKEADKDINNNTPMDDDDNDNKDNDHRREGAVAKRRGLGKRQVGSPETGLALVTPPTKRLNNNSNSNSNSTDNNNNNNNNTGVSAVDAIAGTSAQTPMMSKKAPQAPKLPKFEERTDAGKVILTFNPSEWMSTNEEEEEEDSATSNSRPKCGIAMDQFPETNVLKPYRHLFTTMEDRAKALDKHLVRMEHIMKERYNIGIENDGDKTTEADNDNVIAPLEAVGVPRQDKICCIGRICNAAHEGRLNLTSVVLEGSKHMGGARIEVDLTHLQSDKSNSFSLFPGQIVAIEGMNSTGRKLIAHRICEGAAPGPTKSTAKQLLQYHHDEKFQNGKPLKVVTVSGPYTTSDNLAFEPLYDFMDVVMREKPDVVIMVGPFIDMAHKDIQSGKAAIDFADGESLTVPFEAFFANKVANMLDEFFEQGGDKVRTQFVLVPSLHDATAEWVYPQAPFQERVLGKKGKYSKVKGGEDVIVGSLGLDELEKGEAETKVGGRPFRRVHCAPNPCTLQINEVVIGVTGTDAVFHMSADETNGNLVPGSRLARISQHMLQQQSYYPLFPPALGTNLDLKHMNQWYMPCQPDLLVVPSKLANFARSVLGETVVVNPGQLSKNTTGGTYAIMDIHPMKREDLESAGDDVEMEHNIPERVRVEIKKI